MKEGSGAGSMTTDGGASLGGTTSCTGTGHQGALGTKEGD